MLRSSSVGAPNEPTHFLYIKAASDPAVVVSELAAPGFHLGAASEIHGKALAPRAGFCGLGCAPAAAPRAALWDNPAGSFSQCGWEPRMVPLSVPPVPPQQMLFLAGVLKSRLLLISHLPLSGRIFPGCNCFYLRVDKNYPALGVHEAGAGKVFVCLERTSCIVT